MRIHKPHPTLNPSCEFSNQQTNSLEASSYRFLTWYIKHVQCSHRIRDIVNTGYYADGDKLYLNEIRSRYLPRYYKWDSVNNV